MRALVALWVGLFGFVLIDLNILKRRRIGNSTSVSLSSETQDHKKRNRKQKRKRKKRKYQKRKVYREKIYKLKGTHGKDHRYMDQRKLRRMFRNG